MGKSLRIKIALASAAVLAVAGWFLFSAVWKAEEKAPAPLKILPDKVDLQAKDVLYTEVGRGDVKYEIRAKTVLYLKKENTADFEDVNVKVIMPKGKIYTITSDRGTYDTEKKDISMTGHVVVESDEGERITTDRIYYVDAERKIHTDDHVAMTNRNIEVKGVGLTFLLDERHLTLSHQVQATIRSTR
ncbi:MAG TPA: LPS export ABC transporter periplasmic protein LptC [Syntrophales bacterium]|jgi:LPS export ABC transporter protein LptC|nr:LPS export ABC transporter periplasmic protein LptC [Syntrophales bacterium]HPX56037.1 LPS export ABC transporter periplasmic protein LptC [Syntrophales bacterium]HQA83148.1 LPS export ABC transporter periplasmic protein LptC [Syntrophales bacterium]